MAQQVEHVHALFSSISPEERRHLREAVATLMGMDEIIIRSMDDNVFKRMRRPSLTKATAPIWTERQLGISQSAGAAAVCGVV